MVRSNKGCGDLVATPLTLGGARNGPKLPHAEFDRGGTQNGPKLPHILGTTVSATMHL